MLVVRFYHALLGLKICSPHTCFYFFSHIIFSMVGSLPVYVWGSDLVSNQTLLKMVATPQIVGRDVVNIASQTSDLVAYYENISASVYLITVHNQDTSASPTGVGSAVAVNKNQLLTNCHIFGKKIELDGNIVKVIKKNSPVMNGKLIYKHSESDRCILEVDGYITPVRAIRSVSSLRVGERVYTIGNPKGFVDAFAEGLISAIKPSKKTGITLLSTTGIAKGSSGGALFDARGNLIGITTAVISDAPHLSLVIPAESFFSE